MSAMAMGLIDDLRRRRLLPVALLLLVALVAIPVVALKSAPDGGSVPPPAPTASETPAGLPGPEQALAGDRPLVSLAVLNESSNLDSFDSKNPFKPLEGLATVADGGAAESSPLSVAGTPAGGTSDGGGSGGSAPQGGSSPSPGGGGTGDGDTHQPSPTPQPEAKPEPRTRLTYAVDLAIRGPKGLRRYTGLPKLSLLPSEDNPLFVFLGVEDAGTKAVFLVDAKLRSVEGEGRCTPSAAQCATLALAPGELHELANDQGQTWTIQIGEVRETSVSKAAAAAKAAQTRRARRSTAPVGDTPARRFIPPVITDLFTGGRS